MISTAEIQMLKIIGVEMEKGAFRVRFVAVSFDSVRAIA